MYLSSHLVERAVLCVSDREVKKKFGKGRLVVIGLWHWTVGVKAVAVVAGIRICGRRSYYRFCWFSRVVNELKDVHSHNRTSVRNKTRNAPIVLVFSTCVQT